MSTPSQTPTARYNIMRALGHAGLRSYVETVIEEQKDRIIVRVTSPQMLVAELKLEGWSRDAIRPSFWHSKGLISYREPGAVIPSLQICFRADGLVDIDLDFFNPWGGDLVSFIGHGIEVGWHWISRTKTSPARMAKALDKRFGEELG
jgi:hypothetical protein